MDRSRLLTALGAVSMIALIAAPPADAGHQRIEVVNAEVGGEPVALHRAAGGGVIAYLARAGDDVLVFAYDECLAAYVDEATGSIWDLEDGSAMEGTHFGVRLEQVDYNLGRFASTGRKIFDETRAVTLSASLRPVAGTVFRLNYRRESHRDLLGNPAALTGGFQVGFATYF